MLFRSCDPTQVAVLLPGSGEQPHAFQSQDHKRVADNDDDEGGHESKDEDTDLHEGVPVHVRVWELQGTLCSTWGSRQTCRDRGLY